MRKLLVSVAVALCVFQLWGQGKEYIPIAVVMPKQAEPLDESQIVRLGSITLDLTTRSGLSASSQGSCIIMYPLFVIEKEDVVEGGMQNLTVVSADISFVIKNLETDMIYASMSERVRGSGRNRQRAISDAISKIPVKSEEFSKFISRGRDKILDYYKNNCPAILMQAEAYAKTQQYEDAIALIASIPSVATCYPQALTALEKLYPAYQKQQCNESLRKAQSLYGAHKYIDAMSVLYELNVFSTDCDKEVKSLIHTIEGKMSADEKRAWDLLVEQSRDQVKYAEKRLETIQAIATAYYGRRISNNYNVLIH